MPFQRESLALLKRAKSTTDRSVKKIDTEHDLYIQRKQQKRKGKEQQREECTEKKETPKTRRQKFRNDEVEKSNSQKATRNE